MNDSTQRFCGKSVNYAKYRPTYPKEIIDVLVNDYNLNSSSVVADIGSGTGIFTELLLPHAKAVYAVEPNDEMRKAAETSLNKNSKFISVKGTAENTTLPSNELDVITVAQAFHWFDVPKTLEEFKRILKKDGFLVLLWNARNVETKFMAEYEKVVKEFSDDYEIVKHRNFSEELIKTYYKSDFKKFGLESHQSFDFEELIGRYTSSSYAAKEGSENYQKAHQLLQKAFKENQVNGKIKFEYLVEMFVGRI